MPQMSVRLYGDGFGVFKCDRMLIYGLTKQEAQDCCRDWSGDATSARGRMQDTDGAPDNVLRPAFGGKVSGARSSGAIKGRKLILEPHLATIEAFIAERPDATIKDIDRALRADGVTFSSTVAIVNLLRRFNIELASDSDRGDRQRMPAADHR